MFHLYDANQGLETLPQAEAVQDELDMRKRSRRGHHTNHPGLLQVSKEVFNTRDQRKLDQTLKILQVASIGQLDQLLESLRKVVGTFEGDPHVPGCCAEESMVLLLRQLQTKLAGEIHLHYAVKGLAVEQYSAHVENDRAQRTARCYSPR